MVGGVDVRKYDLQVLRDAVAMVLQKNELFSGTIKENLRWGNEQATDEEVKKPAVLPARMNSLRRCRMDMIPTLNRVEQMSPVDRSSVFVLRGHFLRNRRY